MLAVVVVVGRVPVRLEVRLDGELLQPRDLVVVPRDHRRRHDVRHHQRRHRSVRRLDVCTCRGAGRLWVAMGIVRRHRAAAGRLRRNRSRPGHVDRSARPAAVHHHTGRALVRSRPGVQGVGQRQQDLSDRTGPMDEEPRPGALVGSRHSGRDRARRVRCSGRCCSIAPDSDSRCSPSADRRRQRT